MRAVRRCVPSRSMAVAIAADDGSSTTTARARGVLRRRISSTADRSGRRGADACDPRRGVCPSPVPPARPMSSKRPRSSATLAMCEADFQGGRCISVADQTIKCALVGADGKSIKGTTASATIPSGTRTRA